MAVYSGILEIANNQHSLAALMGHEIAHAVARHGSERASQGVLLDIGTMALETFVLGIRFSDEGFPKDLLSDEIILPSVSIFQAPFLHLLSGQLLSYYMAVGLKRNVDRPRSLAKSVTVA